MTNQNHEHYEALVMKAVDGQLTEQERRELQEHLTICPTCRAELQDFQWIKQSTDQLRQRILQDARLEPFREPTGVTAWNFLHFMLLGLGSIGFVGFSVYSFFLDPQVPVFVKWAAGCAGFGGLGLFLYLLQNRLRHQSEDPYRHIDI